MPSAGKERESPTLLERAGRTAAAIGDVQPKSRVARFALQWGIAALVFGFLIFFVVRQWDKLPNFDWRFAPGWLVVSGAAVAAFYFLQSEYWRVILHSLGAESRHDDDVGHAIGHKRRNLPADERPAVEVDHAFGHVAGQRQKARPLTGGKDDGFCDSHGLRL